MDFRPLFTEKTDTDASAIIISDEGLVRYLTIQDTPAQSHENLISNWFCEFLSRPATAIEYRLFPRFHYQTHQRWENHTSDPYIKNVLLACDTLFHLYQNHSVMPETIAALMQQLSSVIEGSLKGMHAQVIDPVIQAVCAAGAVMPSQPAMLFTERQHAVLQRPPMKFYSLSRQALFTCLCEGIVPNDFEAQAAPKKTELVQLLNEAIGKRRSAYTDEMLECLYTFTPDAKIMAPVHTFEL